METYFVLDLGRKGFEQVILEVAAAIKEHGQPDDIVFDRQGSWMIARFLRAPSAQLTMWKANYAMNPLSRGKEKNAK